MTNKEKHKECKNAIWKQRKRISLWRKLGVSWKGILKELGLSCNEKTLADNYKWRGTV